MKALILAVLGMLSLSATAQKSSGRNQLKSDQKLSYVPLTAENWEFKPGEVEFTRHDSREAMILSAKSGPVVLKNTNFSSGTIEFDLIPEDARFATLYFNWQDKNENECFYLRTDRAEDSTAMDAVQYSPDVSGINLWDLFGQYQGNAYFSKKKWNHVKLVISGVQMRAYVNDMNNPVLEIPRLEGNVSKGTVAFEGESVIANLLVKPGVVENLSPIAGIDLTAHDPRYLRHWQVSKPIEIPGNVDFNYDFIPKSGEIWQPVAAERMGLINLTRQFGGSEKRRLVWLKVMIDSKKEQTKKMALGFSDDVWVFLNGRFLYIDKNSYGLPAMKSPFGRCSIENTSFGIPFKAGENELLIGVANNFFGWAIVARMEDMEGISVIKK